MMLMCAPVSSLQAAWGILGTRITFSSSAAAHMPKVAATDAGPAQPAILMEALPC
jgi:hypothetical protein